MARFKVFVTDNATNNVTEIESNGIFLSMPKEEGAKTMLGADMVGAELVEWLLNIPIALDKAIKNTAPELFATVKATQFFNHFMEDNEEEE